jgi:hypothetical protein
MVEPDRILPLIIGKIASLLQFLIILVYTLPFLFKRPITGIFLPDPRPLFPLTLVGPKYASSISIYPFSLSSLFSESKNINDLKILK